MIAAQDVTERTVRPVTEGEARSLAARYRAVRQCTENLCEPLTAEDMLLQSMPEASPTKWHLAHTTWFFETFVLASHFPGYKAFDPHFAYLFNSYYEALGSRWPRPRRGMLSRPSLADVRHYRTYVDEHMARLFESRHVDALLAAEKSITLGLHHEQQHQELILTDIKHAWSGNPLRPVYREDPFESRPAPLLDWISLPEGPSELGYGGEGFSFDNETPRHRIWLHGARLSSRLVTSDEYLAFMDDGGYERPELWLSDGWAARVANRWTAPLYWERDDGPWFVYTLAGFRPVRPCEPVCHVSFYEADAFARWAGARLPTEVEWETAGCSTMLGECSLSGHFLEGARFHPSDSPAADDRGPLYHLFGDVWQWTASPYTAYPGCRPSEGALGEYNAKFMCNQMVLRGASCATPRSHARATYRNFFPPDARWQFSGIRLARDLT
jgi:ergothioneine biosynthesis protein EgtB